MHPKFVLGLIAILLTAGCAQQGMNGYEQTTAMSQFNCRVDTDCACGKDTETGACFYGNKQFVDASQQCPDFCSGIAGNLEIKCINLVCTQQEKKSAQPSTTQNVKEFRVAIGHTSFNPASFTVQQGDTVRFLAVAAPGTGSHNHGITIDEYGINQAVTREDARNPVVIEFVADKQGTFTVYCKPCWDGPYGRSHPDIRATLVVQ